MLVALAKTGGCHFWILYHSWNFLKKSNEQKQQQKTHNTFWGITVTMVGNCKSVLLKATVNILKLWSFLFNSSIISFNSLDIPGNGRYNITLKKTEPWQVCWEHHLVSAKELRSLFSNKSLAKWGSAASAAGFFQIPKTAKCPDAFILTELWVSALLRTMWRSITCWAIQIRTLWRKCSLCGSKYPPSPEILVSRGYLDLDFIFNPCENVTKWIKFSNCYAIFSSFLPTCFQVGIWMLFHFLHCC